MGSQAAASKPKPNPGVEWDERTITATNYSLRTPYAYVQKGGARRTFMYFQRLRAEQ